MADYGSGFWSSMVNMGMDMTGGIMSAVLTQQQNQAQRDFSRTEAQVQRNWQEKQNFLAQKFATSERLATQEWNREMWNLNNEYNSPSAQMQRMMAAGINPNSAAAQIAGGVSSSAPSSSFQTVSPATGAMATTPGQMSIADSFQSMLNTNANVRAQMAQADLAKAMADKTTEETKGLVIDNNFKPFEKQADLDQAYGKIALMVQQGQLSEAQASQIYEMLPLLKGKTVSEIVEIQEQCANLQEQRNQISEQIRLLSEQIETERHRQKQMDAAAYQAYMNGLESKSAIDLNGKKMSLTEAETDLKKLEKQRGDFDFGVEQHLYERYGWKPGDKQIDRVLDTLGKNIDFFEYGFKSLWDNTKVQLNSLGSKGRSILNNVKSKIKNPFNTPKKDYPLEVDDYGHMYP